MRGGRQRHIAAGAVLPQVQSPGKRRAHGRTGVWSARVLILHQLWSVHPRPWAPPSRQHPERIWRGRGPRCCRRGIGAAPHRLGTAPPRFAGAAGPSCPLHADPFPGTVPTSPASGTRHREGSCRRRCPLIFGQPASAAAGDYRWTSTLLVNSGEARLPNEPRGIPQGVTRLASARPAMQIGKAGGGAGPTPCAVGPLIPERTR